MIKNNNDEILKVLEKSGFKPKEYLRQKVVFKNLMNYRVNNILLVCSLYDYYTIVENGQLQEALFNEYLELNLFYAPKITHTFSGESAMLSLEEGEFDLIISTLNLGTISASEFASYVKEHHSGIPHVLLTSKSRNLQLMIDKGELQDFDKIFIWGGDRRIFLAIIKLYEDFINAPVDCLEQGVMAILLVEDSPVFYSSYLPLIFTEVMNQTQSLIKQSVSTAEKMLRQRARPKILLAENYEIAMEYYSKYKNSLLGIITDSKFRKKGEEMELAGVRLAKKVRKELPHLPIALQSSDTDIESMALEMGVSFFNKNSRTLLLELREFMKMNFGFGDFIFRLPNGDEVSRATGLKDFRNKLKYIPEESLLYHSDNNHFSNWFIARTEFELAFRYKPIYVSQFNNTDQFRRKLIHLVNEYIGSEHHGAIAVFTRDNFIEDQVFSIIGEGSLGGKARGLTFINKLIQDYLYDGLFPGVKITVPKSVVLGTDVFDQFLNNNNLFPEVSGNIKDGEVLRHFLSAHLPATVLGDLREILQKSKLPLAVRSSSLLEDAVYQPFAGVYATVMIPNSSVDFDIRFHNLVMAVKYVYASTFMRNAKNYIEATGNRLENEKMGLIIQEVAGRKFGNFFYPHFSGVARSYNYYPFGKAEPRDGIVNLAIGLGKTIVDGGKSLQYSPAYPHVYPQFSNRKDLFSKSQVNFYSINLNSDHPVRTPSEDKHLSELNISDAEKHDTLKFLASTYSGENDMLYEGIGRTGPRVLNFAPILKSEVIPLNSVVKLLLTMSELAMSCPVEIEFAVVLGKNKATPAEFHFLQVRPMVSQEVRQELDLNNFNEKDFLLKTNMALGNGVINTDHVLFVKPGSFDKSKTRQIKSEISELNHKLFKENKYYMLMGPGRWGSSDHWLGIPVDFSDISASHIIVEMTLPEMVVDPSQGSHFFQNLTSFKIAYLTLNLFESEKVDFAWLNSCKTLHETEFIKLVKTNEPMEIRIDGKKGRAAILKKALKGET